MEMPGDLRALSSQALGNSQPATPETQTLEAWDHLVTLVEQEWQRWIPRVKALMGFICLGRKAVVWVSVREENRVRSESGAERGLMVE